MSPQADYICANGTGAAVRSDINGQLAAIVSNNSGATEPTTMYAYQWWADTTTGLLKIRNAANSAWISLRELDGTLTIEDGTAAAPGLAFTSDLNTGLLRVGADQLAITTGGTSRLAVSTTAVSSTLAVDVPLGAVGTPSITFTGDLNTGLFSPGADTVALVTGGTNRAHVTSGGLVGIGTTSPVAKLQVDGTTTITGGPGNSTANGLHIYFASNTGVISGFNDGVDYRDVILEGKNLRYQISGTEKARIDSSGRLLVGTTTDSGSGALLQTPSLQISPNTTTRTISPGLHGHYNSESVADDATATDLATISYAYLTAIIDIAICNGDTLESAATIMVDVKEATVQSTILGGFSTTNFAVVNGKTGTDAKFNLCLNGTANDSYLAFRNRMGGTRRVSIIYRLIRVD